MRSSKYASAQESQTDDSVASLQLLPDAAHLSSQSIIPVSRVTAAMRCDANSHSRGSAQQRIRPTGAPPDFSTDGRQKSPSSTVFTTAVSRRPPTPANHAQTSQTTEEGPSDNFRASDSTIYSKIESNLQ